jgi:hypothetical protein
MSRTAGTNAGARRSEDVEDDYVAYRAYPLSSLGERYWDIEARLLGA